MSQQAPPGWYAPDPNRPERLRYWDGVAWTEHHAGPAASPPTVITANASRAGGVPGWLTSWPAVIVGLALCFIPGLVLLWMRPGTSARVKAAVTAAAACLLIVGAVNAPVTGPSVGTEVPEASVTQEVVVPTPTPSSAEPTPAASENPIAPSSTPSPPVDQGSAVRAVLALPVKGRAPKTGYDRDQFGPSWVDVDRNGCDSRNDMLIEYLVDRVMSGSCKVLSGTLVDPYTRQTLYFVRGGPSEIDIDHVVALSDAWQKGATSWQYAKRVAFANDPLNLQPTDASANRQKGDSDAASWLPPNKSYRCEYVARQAAVKTKYRLWVTAAEREAMLRVLASCPAEALPPPGPQPTIASNTGGPPPGPSAAPKPSRSQTADAGVDPRFDTCSAAKAAGFGPYVSGIDPEYDWYSDRDGDGVVCE